MSIALKRNFGESMDKKDSKHFKVELFKRYTIRINKQLIVLKLTLFIWYGASLFSTPFLVLLFKQRGVSLAELSIMTIIAPIAQFLGNALSGIVADKIGKSKPVFVANLLILTTVTIVILIVPRLGTEHTESLTMNIFCDSQNSTKIMGQTNCYLAVDNTDVTNCQVQCPESNLNKCDELNTICNIFDVRDFTNLSLKSTINESYSPTIGDRCYYGMSPLIFKNITYWCSLEHEVNCTLSCNVNSKLVHGTLESNEYSLIAYAILYHLYLATCSNCYRCMDVTVMTLTEEHGGNFGHQRFFSMSGILLLSALGGFVVQQATIPGDENNYSAAMYYLLFMNSLLFVLTYFLPVRVNPPGQRMWRKSLSLMKNPDILVFFIEILVLGNSWSFGRYFLFWFLEEMEAPSLLIGLITSVGALYGLPFLFTSKWWMKNIGPNRLIVLAFFGHSINAIGYSFLLNPWISLVLEATSIFTYHLLWVAVVEHSYAIAPEGLKSTIMAITGAIHYGVGKSTAGLVGGFVMSKFGGRAAFRFNAIVCLSTVTLYAFYIYVKRSCCTVKCEQPPTDTIENGSINDEALALRNTA